MVRSKFWAAALTVSMGLGAAVAARAATPPIDSILPDTTKAFLSIPNLPNTDAAFNSSPLGKLLNDPAMQPFLDDVERQLTQKKARLEVSLGISVRDFEGIVSGEAAVAVIRTPEGMPAVTLVADVAGHPEKVAGLLAKADQSLIANGGKRSEQTVKDTKLNIYEMPPLRTGQGPHTAVYFVRDNILVATDNVMVAADLLGRILAPQQNNLASVAAYKHVIQRAQAANPNMPVHISWFIDPIGLADAIRTSDPNPPQGKQDLLKLIKSEGVDAVKGIGGQASFSIMPYGLFHRTVVYAPQPFQRAMRMLSFPNGVAAAPQPWVARDINTYTSFNFDVTNAFDNFGTLFDAMFGEGEEGVWLDVVKSIKEDPNGPMLDLRADLINQLGNHCTVITDNTTPIGPYSQRRLVAVECKNPAAVAESIKKALTGDPNIQIHDFQNQEIYEIIPNQPALPAAGAAAPGAKPNSAVTVAHGHLLIATQMDMLKEIITTPEAQNPLSADPDFTRIMGEVARLSNNTQTAVQGFARNAEKVQVTYEMFRQNRLPETDTPMAQILNAVFNADDGTTPRPARLDGTKLPDFSLVRKYVGVGGTFVSSDPEGWFVVGFTHDPNAPRAAEARRP